MAMIAVEKMVDDLRRDHRNNVYTVVLVVLVVALARSGA